MCAFDHLDEEAVSTALDDALAVVSEWTGTSAHEKLAPFGLDADVIVSSLRERIVALAIPQREVARYVQGFVEGLVTAMKFRLESCGS